ncbi:MAG: 3-dehydroquinate synthase [Campylobacterota bacterium]
MTVDIDLDQNPYTIYLQPLQKLCFDKKVAVVTNPTVSGLWLQNLLQNLQAKQCHIITVRDGEQYKNMATAQYILDNMFDANLDRNSLLIAFGGGVIGDMTGFCASIFQRGIDFVQIPTTLLSQVDASVGGKTGINNAHGKNLVGSFHQPKAVHIDTQFLTTLPKREFSAGVAEIIKMAVMFDNDFFAWLETADLNDENSLRHAIRRAVELKAQVVANDEKEKGVRAVLNYGHTFGHVIENETGYSTYLHGEAVGIGMVMANALACRLDMFSTDQSRRITDLLQQYGIPTTYSIKDTNRFYQRFFYDKKSQDTSLKFILPKAIGDHAIVQNPPKKTVMRMLEDFSKEDVHC